MMKNSQRVCCLLFAVVLFYGCKKSEVTKVDPLPTTPTAKDQDIYISGVFHFEKQNDAPGYWINGVKVLFQDVEFLQTTGIAVAPAGVSEVDVDTVYVTGSNGYLDFEAGLLFTQAAYWRGDSMTGLTDLGYSYATSIALSGNHVYIAGIANGRFGLNRYGAVYWKDNQMVKLNSPNSVATGIAVSGNDVYVSGDNGYWKNGAFVTITGALNVTGITVSGNDVYTVGYTAYRQPGYWKNGALVALTYSGEVAVIRDIKVSGNNVYVCGDVYNAQNQSLAVYWKNGTVVQLSNDPNSRSAGIAVAGDDVYVAGRVSAGAVYWKNGTQVLLEANAEPTGIFLVEKKN